MLGVCNHDDDVLCYWLFEKGREIDAYNSCQEYFDETAGRDRGGDAAMLCAAFGAPAAESVVSDILHNKEYVFAMERHSELVAALQLSDWAVCAGFNYVEEQELPDGLTIDMLIRTP